MGLGRLVSRLLVLWDIVALIDNLTVSPAILRRLEAPSTPFDTLALGFTPTIGFNAATVTMKSACYKIWDVGGGAQIRPLWRHYFLGK